MSEQLDLGALRALADVCARMGYKVRLTPAELSALLAAAGERDALQAEVERLRAGVAGEIAAERERQKSVEGWTEAHDDEHADGELARAAACYALLAHRPNSMPTDPWPWELDAWKQKGPRRDLVRAAALIVAEIERIDRAALAPAAAKGVERG